MVCPALMTLMSRQVRKLKNCGWAPAAVLSVRLKLKGHEMTIMKQF